MSAACRRATLADRTANIRSVAYRRVKGATGRCRRSRSGVRRSTKERRGRAARRRGESGGWIPVTVMFFDTLGIRVKCQVKLLGGNAGERPLNRGRLGRAHYAARWSGWSEGAHKTNAQLHSSMNIDPKVAAPVRLPAKGARWPRSKGGSVRGGADGASAWRLALLGDVRSDVQSLLASGFSRYRI